MSKPIAPEDITHVKAASLPDEVYDAFNELIVKNILNGEATIVKNEAAVLIANKLNISTNEVYSKGYLNIEDIYRNVGWKVKYESPSYDENFDAFYTFSKK